MGEADEDTSAISSILIAKAEAHRVDQMLRIAGLDSDDQPFDQAERVPKAIEGLVSSMRA
ncbi:MAG: hypothetical protein K2Y56_05060 [Methylobacterium sp.]|uniref:hypothetical protein n=1 Tax=Methylobacterium sp. TaxID=409 RepID=UPI0025FE7939|nr:hypothetical protein [Methylobacterium sp.]MBX9930894.1 hypothetical protein [Methylobacterium sp.]